MFSLLALLVIGAASAYGGYLSGIQRRTSFEATQVASKVDEQFQLGVQDLQAGRYELARQRFEYVINLDPDYPGVTENLAAVLLHLNTTATPTPVPTPTLTPTVDLRGAEELFSQAQVLLADGKWSEAIDTLLKLRKNEPSFQAVEVDSMLYVALRNRGVQRILSEGDLEGGTYDLALAERFGPLDVEASNMRTWADLYVTGASFWGLDWSQAVYYFGQLLLVGPNLRDSTNLTATERFRLASIKYGDFLAENKEWCKALEQYSAAFNIGSDPSVEPTAVWVAEKCQGGEEQRDEEEPPTETPVTPEGTPLPETPTPEPPTPEPTPGPTQEPSPTEPYPAPTTP
jgi:tetratricopeptide (TPR) repeat protein